MNTESQMPRTKPKTVAEYIEAAPEQGLLLFASSRYGKKMRDGCIERAVEAC